MTNFRIFLLGALLLMLATILSFFELYLVVIITFTLIGILLLTLSSVKDYKECKKMLKEEHEKLLKTIEEI